MKVFQEVDLGTGNHMFLETDDDALETKLFIGNEDAPFIKMSLTELQKYIYILNHIHQQLSFGFREKEKGDL